jgi:hypothetical protein
VKVKMADNTNLGDFLAQAQRSMGGGAMGRVSGPLSGYIFGPDFFRKQTYLQIADTFVATYGKKVWDSLNNKTVAFNAMKKVDWGPTVGWRLRTDRGSGRSRPVTETGSLPTIDNSNYVGVYSYPRQIVSTFGVSLKGQAVSALEGGIGNQFAVEQEAASRDHIKEINMELMSGSAYRASASGSTTTATFSTSVVESFHVGDTLGWYDTTASAHRAPASIITAVAADTGIITVSPAWTSGGQELAAGDVVYVTARNGITSLPDIACEDTMAVAGEEANVDIYNLTTRTAAGYAAGAFVSLNAGVARALTLPLVDRCFQEIRQKGGEPKLCICGLDQYDNLNQLLQSQQRFMDVTDYIVGAGDERTYPGTRGGFQLATYRGIPILPDPDMPKSVDSAGTLQGSDFMVLDTDYHEIGVMYPTQYVENRDYFAANALVLRGMFITMMEHRCLRPDTIARISDLSS